MCFTELTVKNLPVEHICCAISARSEESGLTLKKAWLNGRIQEGLKFRKPDARGKVLIEYIPAEKAWAPIEAQSGCTKAILPSAGQRTQGEFLPRH